MGHFDQCLTVVEHQCRDAAERIAGAHLNPVAEAGKWPLLERYVVHLERDRDATRKR
jgi:hypothetical protein